MSAQFDSFIEDLKALCVKHGVRVSASDYDNLQVWKLCDKDQPIDDSIEDMTEE